MENAGRLGHSNIAGSRLSLGNMTMKPCKERESEREERGEKRR